MSTVKIKMQVSEEARRQYAVQTGHVVCGRDVYEVDLTLLTTEARSIVVPFTGLENTQPRWISSDFTADRMPITTADWIAIAQAYVAHSAREQAAAEAEKARISSEYLSQVRTRLDELESLDDAGFAVQCNYWRGIATLLPYCEYSVNLPEDLEARYTALKTRYEACVRSLREAEEAATAEREANERIARQERKADRTRWIAEHGSDFLRKAVGAGYDCQKCYVLERAKAEHPGAVVDWASTAKWRSRPCPSEVALDLALKVKGEVVWLMAEPSTNKRYAESYFDPCEAVVVQGYLGKYDVIYMSF